MNLLLLKGFNNYFNRKIKKYSSLDDYKDSAIKYYDFVDVNFNPNDGVSTVQVVGSENQKEDSVNILDWENEGSPDYLVVYESRLEPDPENENLNIRINTIKSRWFVMESVRTRAGQYQLALKRDVIADHLEQVLTNPCFVEKGHVPTDSPLIFNEEGVSFNQIKQSETMLKDETGIPWLVLYIAKNFPASDTPGADGNGNLPIVGNTVLDTSAAIDYDDLPWSNIENGISASSTNITRRIKGASELVISPIFGDKVNQSGFSKVISYSYRANLRLYTRNDGTSWKVDDNTTNSTSCASVSYSYVSMPCLARKDIGITTNPNTTIN